MEFSGVASRRPKNALVGTYVAGVVTLNVTASDDDRLFGSIRMPAETVSFEARSVFGTTRTAMYDVKLSEQCTGWLTVDRSAVGEFATHTSNFDESCPKPLQQFLHFKRTR